MRILLIDDHKLIKIGITVLLEEESFEIDSCSNYEEFVIKNENNNYDLIISDISLPGKSGYDILTYVKKNNDKQKVIMMSMHEDKTYIKKALKLGADGYITKSTAHEEIITAIDTVMNKNKFYINDKYNLIFLEMYEEKQNIELSEREEEVLQHIVKGYTLTEIGEKLFLSVKTVDTYKRRLMEKTQSKNRKELITYYNDNYLV